MILDNLLSLPLLISSLISGVRHDSDFIDSSKYQATISEHILFKHAENLLLFSKLNGAHTRSAGSVGHNATVDYIKSHLSKSGFYDVELQPFSYTYSVGNATFSTSGFVHKTSWFTYGPAGDISAPLAVVEGFGCSKDDFPPHANGKIVLIRRGDCGFSDKVALSGAAGAAGAIIYNNQDDPLGSVTLSSPSNPLGPYIPAGGISGLDGKVLVAAVQAGDPVIGHLRVIATNEERYTANVIATTKSGDKDNIVTLGGHTDSVPAGPGINDNGSGSMGILELALQLPNFRIKNAVRFGFWAGEEFGLLGAKYYAAHLSNEEKANIALYLNFDMLASPNFGYFIYDGDGKAFGVAGPPGSDHIEETFKDFFKTAGLKAAPTKFDGRSDYAPFFNAGIPSGGLLTGAEEIKSEEEVEWWGGEAGIAYDACYHQACDTLENLNVPAWVQNTKGAAHAVATYASSLHGIPRRPREWKQTHALVSPKAPLGA